MDFSNIEAPKKQDMVTTEPLTHLVKLSVKPTDKCPCDSGKKIKSCCLKEKRNFIKQMKEWSDTAMRMFVTCYTVCTDQDAELILKYMKLTFTLDKANEVKEILDETPEKFLAALTPNFILRYISALSNEERENTFKYQKTDDPEDEHNVREFLKYVSFVCETYPAQYAAELVLAEKENRVCDNVELLYFYKTGQRWNLLGMY